MERLRIVVGGMVGQFPLGGVAWDYFHYVLGLIDLGHQVVYCEDTRVWPGDPVNGGFQTVGATYTRDFLHAFFRDHLPPDRGTGTFAGWRYVLGGDERFGMPDAAFDDFCRSADLFLNVSGACQIPDALSASCRKVFLDTDPGWNQIRIASRPAWAGDLDAWVRLIDAHDRHFTYAENLHASDCRVPRLEYDWVTTRPVVTLSDWQDVRRTPPPTDAPFTTVMGYDWFPGDLVHDGVAYGTKVPQFERCFDLPHRTAVPLRLAIGGTKTPVDDLRVAGWDVVDGRTATLTPASYRRFIADSAGEWSVAKDVYVSTRSGWFSCRTACYLAAGRPAVVQETGWSAYYPSGTGLIAFATPEEAVNGLERVAADPVRHRDAAYDLAREHLAPDRVLPAMLGCLSLG